MLVNRCGLKAKVKTKVITMFNPTKIIAFERAKGIIDFVFH